MKFEAGKQYTFKIQGEPSDTIYECLYVCPNGEPVFQRRGENYFPFVNRSTQLEVERGRWSEYTPPKKKLVEIWVGKHSETPFATFRDPLDPEGNYDARKIATFEFEV